MHRALALLATGLIVLAIPFLAGCGSDGGTKTVTQTVTDTDPVSTTDSGTDATDTTATDATPTTTTAQAPLRDSGLEPDRYGILQFSTPSKNIGCVYSDKEVRCDIAKKDWSPPATPSSCRELNYGDALAVDTGKPAFFVCHGDTAMGGKDLLAYGTYVDSGGFRCESTTAGLTCKDDSTGNGFFLSRQSYKLLGA